MLKSTLIDSELTRRTLILLTQKRAFVYELALLVVPRTGFAEFLAADT